VLERDQDKDSNKQQPGPHKTGAFASRAAINADEIQPGGGMAGGRAPGQAPRIQADVETRGVLDHTPKQTQLGPGDEGPPNRFALAERARQWPCFAVPG